MFRTDNFYFKILLILNLILIAGACIFTIIDLFALKDNNALAIFCCLANLYALAFSAFYIVAGYRKSDAKIFKAYGASFVLVEILTFVYLIRLGSGPIVLVITALAILVILILLFGRDLGRNMSLALCLVLIVLAFGRILCDMAMNYGTENYLASTILFVLSTVYGTMNFAKYIDKAERGTK